MNHTMPEHAKQYTLDEKLDDLISTLKVSNHPWTAWEREFIADMKEFTTRTDGGRPFGNLSEAQRRKIEQLWDKL